MVDDDERRNPFDFSGTASGGAHSQAGTETGGDSRYRLPRVSRRPVRHRPAPQRSRLRWLAAYLALGGVVLAVVVLTVILTRGQSVTGQAEPERATRPPSAEVTSGPIEYRVTGPARAVVTYSAGGSLGSVSRSVRLPWRVSVAPGGPGSVYTVSVIGGAGECAVTRGGEDLDRRQAVSGRPLVCSWGG